MHAFTVALCTVLVVQVLGQEYGRIRKPKLGIHPKPIGPPHPKPLIHPKPIEHIKPMHGGIIGGGMVGGLSSGGLSSLQGGLAGGMLPPHIRNLIGSTITGMDMIGGTGDLPRHGGAGIGENFADGLRNGWGADPNSPQEAAVTGWVDPLQGMAFPQEYTGGDLIFDKDAGHYVMKSQQAAVNHDIKKSSSGIGMDGVGIGANVHHDVAKASAGVGMGIGGIGMGVGPIEHNVAKASSGMGASGIGMGVGPIEHNIAKASSEYGIGAGGIGMGGGPIEHNVAKASSGMGMGASGIGMGVGPIEHNIAKASSGMGMGAGGFGIGVGPIEHNIAKASSGMGMEAGGFGMGASQIKHNIAKASGGVGMGVSAIDIGVNPMGHNIAKASGGVGMGVATVQHNIVKSSSGLGDPYNHDIAKSGGVGFASRPVMGAPLRSNPVHDVNKVGASGIAGMHHDPTAAKIGHGIAKQTIHESSRIIDMGTNGAVSMGNPLAEAAAHNLAKESVHVAKKTLNLASGAGGVGHPKPKIIGGYGRRRG